MSKLVPIQAKSLKELEAQMHKLVISGVLPKKIDTPHKAFAIAQMGQELGMLPMQACNAIFVEPKSGKPCLLSQDMHALIERDIPEAIIDIVETTNERCAIDVRRSPKHKKVTFAFTIEDAKNANLTSKDNWKNYPRAMLRSRCISEMARAVFPDALCGFKYTPEELGASVDEEGTPLEINVTPSAGIQRSNGTQGTHDKTIDMEPVQEDAPERKIVANATEAYSRKLDIDTQEPMPDLEKDRYGEPTKPFNALEKLEAAKKALAAGKLKTEESPLPELEIFSEKEPESDLGDFKYEVGMQTNPNYGKKLSQIPWEKKAKGNIFVVQNFVKSSIEKSRSKGYRIEPKEEAALFMIDKYIAEQEELNK